MASIDKAAFGEAAGREVSLFTLNNAGLTAKITDFGGILTEMRVPDRDGTAADVVLGFDNLERYLAGHPFFGALAGRYANRIAKGRFELDGETYQLATNEKPAEVNHLHGGIEGFDKKIWDAVARETDVGPQLALTYVSPDGEEGYPGTLFATAVYTLAADALELSFTAASDKTTVVNLVNHSYWNLAGAGSGDILDHRLKLHAGSYTPADRANIPSGEIAPVDGTPFDFREEKAIGRDMALLTAQIGGYDHNFVVDGEAGTLRPAAELFDPRSGRVMSVSTTAPGVQFYTAFKMDGSIVGKEDKTYAACAGLCLETQHFPDSPNRPEFPSTVLQPGETYRHQTVYRFSTRN